MGPFSSIFFQKSSSFFLVLALYPACANMEKTEHDAERPFCYAFSHCLGRGEILMFGLLADWWFMWMLLGTVIGLLWIGDRVTDGDDDDVWPIVRRDLAHEKSYNHPTKHQGMG